MSPSSVVRIVEKVTSPPKHYTRLNASNCIGRAFPQNVLYLLRLLFSPIVFSVTGGLTLRWSRRFIVGVCNDSLHLQLVFCKFGFQKVGEFYTQVENYDMILT